MIKNLVFFPAKWCQQWTSDEAIATVSIILSCAAMKLLKKRKDKRNCWTRPCTMLCVLHLFLW